MPARPSPRPRPRPAPQRCAWDGCRRVGEGNPPLCDVHYEDVYDEADDPSQFAEVVEEVMDHPQVRRVADHVVGLLDKLAGVVERVKRGDAAPQGRAPRPTADLAAARQLFHFGAQEPLTEELIRKRKHALAQMVHPDHGGSGDAMARINEAAKVLLQAVSK